MWGLGSRPQRGCGLLLQFERYIQNPAQNDHDPGMRMH
jgi:hypothetical protein